MEIKPTESAAEHRFCLYDSIAYDLVKTAFSSGRKQRWKNTPVAMLDFGPCHSWETESWTESAEMETFLFFLFRFSQTYDSGYDSDFWFSLEHKRYCDSDSGENSH